MENLNKKIRSTKAQITFLSQYMLENPDVGSGDYRSPMSTFKNNAEWRKLKQALDELGPKRSVHQWKICWRDQKRKARVEARTSVARTLKQATDATGSVLPISNLINTSSPVLDTIKQEKDVGCGPQELPIDFNQDTTLHPAAQPSSSQSPVKSSVQCRAKRRKARPTLPPERFLNAQIELNNLIKELIKEVHRSNELREEHLNLLRDAAAEKVWNGRYLTRLS